MMHPPASDPFDGILLVDKPAAYTSHDVVAKVRRHFNLRKVGHGGTLDPSATGLLILLLGRATRYSGYFLSSDKTYEGVMRLGVVTDSYDADGAVTGGGDPAGVTREQVEAEMAKFRGDLFQTPPMISAVKVNGVALHKRARRGEEDVERKPRFIHIYEFRITGFQSPESSFVLRCTKGTYVRSLCHDIGQALGCGAILSSLRRTRSGIYSIEQATPLDRIIAMDRNALLDAVIPLHRLTGLPGGPRPL